MTQTYHYGVPAKLIWTSHILFGLFFIYLGYRLLENKPINKYISILLIVMGVMAILYHSHLWYNYSYGDYDKKEETKK
jgi:hypothetical protein